ncbi:MAG: hypothetical protein AAF125_00265 [Chloroflexota bacterium]
MPKNLDVIAVGVITFLVAVIYLAIRPGYTPVDVSDEALALTAGEITIEGEPVLDGEVELELEDEE